MFESETIIAWLHSQKTATDEYFILNFFPPLHTDVRCFITLFWPVEGSCIEGTNHYKSARKLNLLGVDEK